jgi:hypothetical protein
MTQVFRIAAPQKDLGGYRDHHAAGGPGLQMVTPKSSSIDSVRLDQPPVPIGVTCRLCDRTDCDQRAFPPLQQPFKIDENLRRTSFYARIEGGGE